MCPGVDIWISEKQICELSDIRIDENMGRCKIIGCVVDLVVFGRRKVFLARRAEQIQIQILKQVQKQIQKQTQVQIDIWICGCIDV